MSKTGATWNDTNFKNGLKNYLDFKRNVDPKTELRRRAKNVGMRLVGIFKTKGVSLSDITSKARSLGGRLKVRPKILAKGKALGWTWARILRAETNARRSAKGFTSTGWFPSVEKLGGSPKRAIRPGGGPRRGKLIEKMGTFVKSETLVNEQPGAGHTADKTAGDTQKALDDETADMAAYVDRKLRQAARRNGL